MEELEVSKEESCHDDDVHYKHSHELEHSAEKKATATQNKILQGPFLGSRHTGSKAGADLRLRFLESKI